MVRSLSLCFLPSHPASSLPAFQPDRASLLHGHASSSSYLASLLPAWTFTFPSPPSKSYPFFSIMSPWYILKEWSWHAPNPSKTGAPRRFYWTVPVDVSRMPYALYVGGSHSPYYMVSSLGARTRSPCLALEKPWTQFSAHRRCLAIIGPWEYLNLWFEPIDSPPNDVSKLSFT